MKRKSVFGAVIIILAALCLAAGAYAQAKIGGPEGMANLKRMDSNGDGKVSQNEFDGPPNYFETFDVNKDGFLGPDECPAPLPGQGGTAPVAGTNEDGC
jgi:hypothetical protein